VIFVAGYAWMYLRSLGGTAAYTQPMLHVAIAAAVCLTIRSAITAGFESLGRQLFSLRERVEASEEMTASTALQVLELSRHLQRDDEDRTAVGFQVIEGDRNKPSGK
jgi:hypothetical protein